MRLVTFGVAQAPHSVGDTRLVPDDVAGELERGGCLSGSEPWPVNSTAAPAPEKPKRPTLQPTRPAGRPADQRMAR